MNATPGESRSFWEALQELADAHPVKIDRRRGSQHPRYPDFIYPLDYGFLEGTISQDGGGVDVWLGTDQEPAAGYRLCLTGLLLTVDQEKQDVEAKLLLNCTHEEMETAFQASNSHLMKGILLKRDNLGENSFEGSS
jgi:inorganic pyrophosphatase